MEAVASRLEAISKLWIRSNLEASKPRGTERSANEQVRAKALWATARPLMYKTGTLSKGYSPRIRSQVLTLFGRS